MQIEWYNAILVLTELHEVTCNLSMNSEPPATFEYAKIIPWAP